MTEREERFKTAYDAIERVIELRWGIPVLISEVLDPNTGDFDGAEIRINHENDTEVALFVLAHLFGHTAQWATNERSRELGWRYATQTPPPDLFEEVRNYERDASRIALQLFHEAGVESLDAWLSEWAAADWDFLEHFYLTGERVDFRMFLHGSAPLLKPLPIPDFSPKKWFSRSSF